jgi:hypothetical protein
MTTMLKYHPERSVDADKHLYELLPANERGRHDGYRWLLAGRSKNATAALQSAKTRADSFLDEFPDVARLHVYHTYPSPGPVRRFVGWYTREHGLRNAA